MIHGSIIVSRDAMRKAGGYDTSRRINIEVDIFIRILRLEKQQFSDDHVGNIVVYTTNDKDHPIFEQSRRNIIRSFTPSSLLDDHRD